MFRRPTPSETDEDLQNLEKQLFYSGSFVPSAACVHSEKRKANEPDGAGLSEHSSTDSVTKRSDGKKKIKESIIDQTMLREAVSSTRKEVVLGRIVDRDIACVLENQVHWQPNRNTTGYPVAPVIQMKPNSSTPSCSSVLPQKKKSLFSLHLERTNEKRVNRDSAYLSLPVVAMETSPVDSRLSAIDEISYVKSTHGVLNLSDCEQIHAENFRKISAMDHNERVKEREELMQQLTPEQITLLMQLRKRREAEAIKEAKHEVASDIGNATSIKDADLKLNIGMEMTELENTGPEKCETETMEPQIQKRVTFAENVEVQVIEANDVKDEVLPIPLKEAMQWIHMDKFEKEKLQWMSQVATPKPLKNLEGFVARFDFEGNLLAYDVEVSYREALHHHGQEPGRAGYTLDELLIWIRSQLSQQRQMGLQTLGNILRNNQRGMFDNCFEENILSLMIESGLVILIRFAIDDASPLVYQAAIRCLYFFLVNEIDEECLAIARDWVPGERLPCITSRSYVQQSKGELEKEENELKDIEILQLDIVKALLRMDMHLRIRYILETLRPPPDTVLQCLAILTRCGRHSLSVSWTLFSVPRLMQVVMDNFLPHNLSPLLTGEEVSKLTCLYGVPLWQAIKMVRVLAAHGKQIATQLCDLVMDHLPIYVSTEPSELGVPRHEALHLSQEAYGLWGDFLAYGLTAAQESFAEFYPMFVRQLVFYRDKVPVGLEEFATTHEFNYRLGAQMVRLLTKALDVAATRGILESRMKHGEATKLEGETRGEVLAPPVLSWTMLNDVAALVLTCLSKWLVQFGRGEGGRGQGALAMVGSCCWFISTLWSKERQQESFSADDSIETFYSNFILPFINSPPFANLLHNMETSSALTSNLISRNHFDPSNLASLGSLTCGGEVTPLLREKSPFPLLVPFFRLISTIHSLHQGLTPPFALLEATSIVTWLEGIVQSPRVMANQWFTRMEVHLLYHLVQITTWLGATCPHTALYRLAALMLLPCVQRGDEFIIKDIVMKVVCTDEFNLEFLAGDIRDMTLNDMEPLTSRAISQVPLTAIQMMQLVRANLHSIGSVVANGMVPTETFQHSLVIHRSLPYAMMSLAVEETHQKSVLDGYWQLVPVTNLMPKKLTEQDGGSQTEDEKASPEIILLALRCLQLTYWHLRYHKHTILFNTDVTGWVRRLSVVFLCRSDLFLDPIVNSYLQGCLAELVRDKGYFMESKDQLGLTLDWYRLFIQHYMGVSYGDSLFALFLVIPQQCHWPPSYRELLWGDLNDVLPLVNLTCQQVEQFVPLNQFLNPIEEAESVITKYKSALGAGIVSPSRTPFLYRVATHHVANYMTNGNVT